jgi:uncharacterized protein YbjT (DUF2867 family)
VVAFQLLAALVHIGDLDRRALDDFALVGLFLAGDHLEQRRLAGSVRTDDADDGTRWHDDAQVIDQQAVAKGFGHA